MLQRRASCFASHFAFYDIPSWPLFWSHSASFCNASVWQSLRVIFHSRSDLILTLSIALGDFASIQFVGAAPASYDHRLGGGSFNCGSVGVDIKPSLEASDYACGDIVAFLFVVRHPV